MDAIDREEFGEAEALCRRAMMLRPDSHEARQIVSSALIEQHRYWEAANHLEEVLEVDPEDLAALADYGLCLFEMCEFSNAEIVLARALEIEPSDPQACYWMALCIERRGQYQLAEKYFHAAHEMDPEAYPRPARVGRETFMGAVSEALAQFPGPLKEPAAGIEILVEDLPREDELMDFDPPIDPCVYGLYVGKPKPDRDPEEGPVFPEAICLYQRNLERFCPTRESLIEEIRVTLLHEIGQFIGFSASDLAKRGMA